MRLMGTPEWVFRWRGMKSPILPKLFAVGITAGLFALLFSTIRINAVVLDKSAPRKASLIYLRNDVQGRALSLRAQEGGPFPSKFDPLQWPGIAEIEASVMEAVSYQPKPYTPALQDLAAPNQLQLATLAAKGKAFFPKHQAAESAPMDHSALLLAPTLYPLSGVTLSALPTELPPFEAKIDGEMSAASWRFLIHLNPEGYVLECVSLENGGQDGISPLEEWLKRIQFQPNAEKSSHWIAVGIGFTNHSADGPAAQ